MSDLSAVLEQEAIRDAVKNSAAWGELTETMRSRAAPQALAAVVPAAWASAFRDLYARLVLCKTGNGADGCVSCASWREDGHPDLVVAGQWGKAPGVADCISFQAALHLKPVTADGRLGVVAFADELSLPAANSLLKVTEEPPEGARIVFIAEQDNLIPTIRSRVWTIRFDAPAFSGTGPQRPPEKPGEWAAWMERTKKTSLEELAAETEGWALWLCDNARPREAAAAKNFMYIAAKRHIPISMVQDALHALLKEGVRIEQIFGDLRET